jgi:hypothetical protein
MEDSIFDDLSCKFAKEDISFDAALKEIDCAFNAGEITQREWARLYQMICDQEAEREAQQLTK